MNSLLPDDVVREKAELKIEEMRFEVHSPRAAHAPPYYRREREVRRYSLTFDCIPLIRICFLFQDLLPPRHLRAFIGDSSKSFQNFPPADDFP